VSLAPDMPSSSPSRPRQRCHRVGARVPIRAGIDRLTGRQVTPVGFPEIGKGPSANPEPLLTWTFWSGRPAVLGDAVGSPQNREHEMGDPVALDADRRVAEQDVL
jgi:hypothetical protein